MSIAYTAKIVSKDVQFNNMTIEFSAEGYETITVGTPLPTVDQDLKDIIKAYAPVQQWLNSKKTLQDVEVGLTIDVSIQDQTLPPVNQVVSPAPAGIPDIIMERVTL